MHPTFGVGAGLSCSLIGEDMEVMSNTVCNRMLPQLYIMLVILGVISFAIMFTLCFLTCSAVRHYDQYMQEDEEGEAVGSGSGSGSNSDEENKQTEKSKANTEKSNVKRSINNPGLASSSREILEVQEEEANGSEET